jgi:rubredoxin
MPVKRFRCLVCGYVYSPVRGEPSRGIPAGTEFDDLPDTYTCPVCGATGRGTVRKPAFEPWFPTAYICTVCGYVYDENRGEPASGYMPGVKFGDLPDTYVCPVCGLMFRKKIGKDQFRPLML